MTFLGIFLASSLARAYFFPIEGRSFFQTFFIFAWFRSGTTPLHEEDTFLEWQSG